MGSFARYRPPTKINILQEQLSERLKRTVNATKKISHGTQDYVFNKTTDRKEMELSLYRQRYSSNWKRKLMTLSRVRLQPDMFVINEENDIDQNFRVKEALVYSIFETVMDPKNPETCL